MHIDKKFYYFRSRGSISIILDREDRQALADVIQILRNTSNPQVENIIKVMKKWAKDNRVPI